MVLIAEDGIAGYKMVADNSIDIILSDIGMPNMDGLQFLQLLQSNKETARIPFVFLTAKTEMNDLREGMNFGADDYVIKPFETKQLVGIINQHMRKKNNRDQEVGGVKEKLIASFPHEAKTIVGGVIGFSELIANEGDALSHDDIKGMARVINNSGKQLRKRIEKFLRFTELVSLSKKDVANIVQRTGNFSLDPFTMNMVLKKTAKEYQRENDINISFDYGVLQIHEKLYQTVINELLEYKIKSSIKGTGLFVCGCNDGDIYRTKVFGKALKKKRLSPIEELPLQQLTTNFSQYECIDEKIMLLKDSLQLFNGYMKISSGKNNQAQIEFGIPVENKRRRNEQNLFN